MSSENITVDLKVPLKLEVAYAKMDDALNLNKILVEFYVGLNLFILFSKYNKRTDKLLTYKGIPVRVGFIRPGYSVVPYYKTDEM